MDVEIEKSEQFVGLVDPTMPEEVHDDVKKENVFLKMDWDLHFLETVATTTKCTAESGPKVNAVFRWHDKGDEVYLAGSYDNWSTKLRLVKSGSEFFTIKELPQGTHEYRYLVDGEWTVHHNEPIIDGSLGCQCNVVTVTRSDCDVFAALTIDDYRSSGVIPICHNSGWTQELPPKGSGYTFQRSGPPLIPPHLTKTILNEETPLQCDPTILMQPAHVVLNHLYTLSIKDGVLVLGTTYRYRKKYITAVLYKPI